MNELVEVPHPAEIEDAPQSAVLAVVEHALAVVVNSLLVEHPSVGQLGECYAGHLPPRQYLLAQLIVDRCRELSELIQWYRRSCPRSQCRGGTGSSCPEDEPF